MRLALAAADFDGDGHLDRAAANHEADQVTLLQGRGGGTCCPLPSSPLRSGVEPHVHLVAAEASGAAPPPRTVPPPTRSSGTCSSAATSGNWSCSAAPSF